MTQPSPEPNPPGPAPGTENQAPYSEYLNKFPEAMRPMAEPIFKEWDSNVTRLRQSDLDKVSQYQPYEKYINEWEPEAIETAINLAQILESQPETLFTSLAQSLGYEIDGAGSNDPDDPDNDAGTFSLADSPEFRNMQEQLGGLADFLQNREAQAQEKEELAQVQQEISAMKEKYGEFDLEYVLTKASITGNLEAAVQDYQKLVGKQANELLAPGQQAPIVGGSNGTMPSNTEDRSKWTPEQRREAAVAILKAANAQQS
jgi:hypothetical protein